MKFPGTSAVYALFLAVFGESIAAVHFGLLIVNALTVWVIYLLGRRLLNPSGAIAAAAAYAVLSSGWSVMGMWAHATHFVVLPAAAGLLLLLRWRDRPEETKNLIWSGLLFGTAVLMKQHGILFAMFAAALIPRGHTGRPTSQSLRSLLLFAAAVTAPALLM